jgi:putative transcriptional regulator
MKVTHHPSEHLLVHFATGKLDAAEHLVVSVHIARCGGCQQFIAAIERLGGTAIEAVDPVPMSAGAFDSVMMRIVESSNAKPQERAPDVGEPEDADLPEILRRHRIGRRRRIAPGVSLRPILLTGTGRSRAFLLQSAPGTRMLEHTHRGTELTCVLKGSFSHQGGHYWPGDFDFGDDAVDHRPIVGREEPCLCIVAMSGDLRMKGLLGRLINPFVRL